MGMEWGTAAAYPAVYEELMVPAFFRFYADDLAARASLRDGDRALDVACGTAIVPRALAAAGIGLGRLTGLDATPAMLAVAAQAVGDLEVELVEGDATAMPFADHDFDVVTCQQGLQFFPDRGAALAEFRRVLSPGGRVLVSCWTPLHEQTAHGAFFEAIAPLEPDLAAVGAAPFSLGSADELGGLLAAAGLRDVAVVRVAHTARFASAEAFVRSFAEGSPLALALATLEPGRDEELRAVASPQLARFEDGDGLGAPMVSLVATATA
jgi:SAM-dependent methyltransferase